MEQSLQVIVPLRYLLNIFAFDRYLPLKKYMIQSLICAHLLIVHTKSFFSRKELIKLFASFSLFFQQLSEILHKIEPTFDKRSCRYTIERGRESTARVVIWREFDVSRSYTIESTFSGCNLGKLTVCIVILAISFLKNIIFKNQTYLFSREPISILIIYIIWEAASSKV